MECCNILAAQSPCSSPAKDYKLRDFYLTMSRNQLYVRYIAGYAKASKRGKNYQIIIITKIILHYITIVDYALE